MGLPSILIYQTHADHKSLFNTPPVFGVYMIKLVLEWIRNNGGLAGMEKIDEAKKDLLCGAIDAAPDFYKGAAEKPGRSWRNVTMRLPSEDLETRFIRGAKGEGLMGLKGHGSVGGIRFWIYNAVSLEEIEKTVDLMDRFHRCA